MSEEIHRVLGYDETRDEIFRLLVDGFGPEPLAHELTYSLISRVLAHSLPVVDARSTATPDKRRGEL